MTNIRIILLLLFVALGALVGYFGWNRYSRSLCPNINCIRMSDISEFSPVEIYADTTNVFRGLYQHNERFLRIEAKHSSPETAPLEIASSVTKIKAMFEKAPAPYPGDISSTIVCDPKFVPTQEDIQNEDTHLSLFVGYLNDRMTFGSCSADQAVYRGILALTYCPKRSLLLRIELITKVADFISHEKQIMDQIRTLECGS